MSWFKPLALAGLLLVLAGCGFQPVFGTSVNGPSAGQLADIGVNRIKDRVGQMLRNELVAGLTPLGVPARPRLALSVTISEDKRDLGVTKSDIATRANLTLTARFSLASVDGGRVLFSGNTQVISSFNILSADFGTLAAEADARRRGVGELANKIQNRLLAFFLRNPDALKAVPKQKRDRGSRRQERK